MVPAKVLADVVSSATGAKAHYDVWWALVSTAKPEFAGDMNRFSDFFGASEDAHYTAFFVYFAQLYDRRPDSSSLPTYLNLVRNQLEANAFQGHETLYLALAQRARPIIQVRHKRVAHIDARLSESDVFAPLNLTWNQIRAVIHETAAFVELLAGAPHQGAIGIPRDGRLAEGTLKMLRALAGSA